MQINKIDVSIWMTHEANDLWESGEVAVGKHIKISRFKWQQANKKVYC